ncbi:hypothetical protein V12B01_12615 [Vibrio splendidus 12B01]|nr:hypothetical protein V12B01_12615 [Vibrio splendidus 12B01]
MFVAKIHSLASKNLRIHKNVLSYYRES